MPSGAAKLSIEVEICWGKFSRNHHAVKDLTQGSVLKHLLQMAVFLAVSMAVQTLYLLADLYWVGRLGKEAIAAVGLAGNLTMIVLALTQMLGSERLLSSRKPPAKRISRTRSWSLTHHLRCLSSSRWDWA